MDSNSIAHTKQQSSFVSRDLSWLQFNYRVLDQAMNENRSLIDRLKFLAITSSNLDEFCTIRLGSLYNYLDYAKERYDYSGLRESPFRNVLLDAIRKFVEAQNQCYTQTLFPRFKENGFHIVSYKELNPEQMQEANRYFQQMVFPMLTPMVFDNYHTFPILKNNRLLLGVITHNPWQDAQPDRISFIQIPSNIPRFYELKKFEGGVGFVPIEQIICRNIGALFRNVDIVSTSLFRINRNGDFTLDESEDIESNFLEELRRKLQTRRTGRVVRLDIDSNFDRDVLRILKIQWDLDTKNIITIPAEGLLDLSCVNQIINHREFQGQKLKPRPPVKPLSLYHEESNDWYEVLKTKDVLLHHPYNSMEPVLQMLEQAANDPKVLSIKITIYRLAKDSRISAALLKASENGKHVSVLFEVKARFDEENNLREAQKLQKAGCFVIYGMSNLKTHTKLLLIVRNEGDKVYRYVHLSSGNYNEATAQFYTDIGYLTTKEEIADDVSDFFNVITGHSQPSAYRNLITSPIHMRLQLINLIHREEESAKQGLPSGIIIKVNSLQDKELMEALYAASQAGVPIRLIVRGICCLRPVRENLSATIQVTSIIGDYLEHARIYYFHQQGKPKIYIGSADSMVRSFDRRVESLFSVMDENLKAEVITILQYNLRDNVNAYKMNEDGSYTKCTNGDAPFNIHREFFDLTPDKMVKEIKF